MRAAGLISEVEFEDARNQQISQLDEYLAFRACRDGVGLHENDLGVHDSDPHHFEHCLECRERGFVGGCNDCVPPFGPYANALGAQVATDAKACAIVFKQLFKRSPLPPVVLECILEITFLPNVTTSRCGPL